MDKQPQRAHTRGMAMNRRVKLAAGTAAGAVAVLAGAGLVLALDGNDGGGQKVEVESVADEVSTTVTAEATTTSEAPTTTVVVTTEAPATTAVPAPTTTTSIVYSAPTVPQQGVQPSPTTTIPYRPPTTMRCPDGPPC